MRKRDREDLYVAGLDPVEVDYSQMAVRTVYAVKGLPYAGEDAYIIPGHKRYRAGIKKLVSAMLYASKPLTQFPRGVREMLPNDANLARLLERINRPTHRSRIASIGGLASMPCSWRARSWWACSSD